MVVVFCPLHKVISVDVINLMQRCSLCVYTILSVIIVVVEVVEVVDEVVSQSEILRSPEWTVYKTKVLSILKVWLDIDTKCVHFEN